MDMPTISSLMKHCIITSVVLGSNLLLSGGQRYNVQSIVIQENYNPDTLENDVSVMKLTEEIQFNDKVKAVPLDNSYVPGPDRGTVTGWGFYNNNERTPNQLQMLDVNILTVSACQIRLRNVRGLKYTKDNICAYNRRNQGVCQGDSGGPLVRRGKQVGVVSWNIPCGKGYPDVNARITSFMDWIQSKTQN